MRTDFLFPAICIFPSLIFVGAILLITRVAQKGKLSYTWLLLPIGLSVVNAIVLLISVIYDSSGLVRFLIIVSLITASITSFVVAYSQDRKTIAAHGRKMMSLYFTGSILTIAASIFAIAGSAITIKGCEAYHLKVGNMLVASLENYFRDHDNYPKSLLELAPQYIDPHSIKTCYSFNFVSPPDFGEFHYRNCSSDKIQVSIPEMGTSHFHIYDFIDKRWYTSNGDPLGEWQRVTWCP